jgi:hypothetical protein
MNASWPVADFDQVRRLHALAAGVYGAHVTERLIHAPFDVVWPVLSDLENEFTNYELDMRRVRLARQGDRLIAYARGSLGLRAAFDVDLQPGWCWMQSRFLLIGVAATPAGTATTVAVTGGIRIPGRAALVPVGVQRANHAVLTRIAARVSQRT